MPVVQSNLFYIIYTTYSYRSSSTSLPLPLPPAPLSITIDTCRPTVTNPHCLCQPDTMRYHIGRQKGNAIPSNPSIVLTVAYILSICNELSLYFRGYSGRYKCGFPTFCVRQIITIHLNTDEDERTTKRNTRSCGF